MLGRIFGEKTFVVQGLKVPPFRAKFNFDTPKGVMNLRKNLIRRNKLLFRHFVIQQFCLLLGPRFAWRRPNLKKKKTFVAQGLKVPPFRAKFNFDNPKGVMNLRKKSHSTKKNVFRHFVIQRFCFFAKLWISNY